MAEQVADKNCEKIHYIAPNIYCCGAGTAADTENTTALISSQLELLRLVRMAVDAPHPVLRVVPHSRNACDSRRGHSRVW